MYVSSVGDGNVIDDVLAAHVFVPPDPDCYCCLVCTGTGSDKAGCNLRPRHDQPHDQPPKVPYENHIHRANCVIHGNGDFKDDLLAA